MVFHWDLSDNKSPRVSRNLLSIQADFDNNVFWMAPICPFLFPSLLIPLPLFWRLFQVHKLQLVSPIPSRSIDFFF